MNIMQKSIQIRLSATSCQSPQSPQSPMGRLVRIDNQPESSRTCLRAILWTGQDSLDQGMPACGLYFEPARTAWIRACLPTGYLLDRQDSLDQGMPACGLSFFQSRTALGRAGGKSGSKPAGRELPESRGKGNQAVNLPGENCLKAGAKEIRQCSPWK